jgi:DNA-directed RNA polymerase specialized sigma54-like protein
MNTGGQPVQEQPPATTPTLQQQFDALTQRKLELWDQIKDNPLYELTDQWKEIAKVDEQLWNIYHQLKGGK